jgi:L-lactate dehydrogenase complex protein LldG
MERTAFLERVRRALDGVSGPRLARSWPRTPASGDGVDPEAFAAALARNNGVARTVARSALVEAVLDEAREIPSPRVTVVTEDTDPWRAELDRALDEARAEVLRPSGGEWRDAAAGANLGITSAALGLSATGSVLIVPSPGSPRVASLLPETHLVILPVSRLVPGLEEALEAVAAASGSSSAPVLITGPSRTSDIEMTTVFGVHGPRSLRVLVIEGE